MCAYHMYIVLKFNNKYSLLCFYISCVLMIDRAKRESNLHVITLIIHP